MLGLKKTEAQLHCHPDTPCAAVASLTTAISWGPGKLLNVVYRLKGAIDRLRVVPYQSLRRGERLWRRTCFEAFIAAKNDAEYYEFNFSPSGEWAAYAFRDYRDGAPYAGDGFEPKINEQRSDGTFEFSAAIELDRLPGIQTEVRLCLGLSTIIEDLNGSLSYWALKHPPGRPDFHHADSFALELEPVVGAGGADDVESASMR